MLERDRFSVAGYWRRRLTESVVGVLSVNDLFASRRRASEISTADVYEKTTRDSPGPRVRFTLTYQFGAPPKGPQPPEDGGAPRMPGS